MTEDNFNAIVRAADPSATDIKTETRRLVTISGYADGFVNSLDISNESGQFVAKGWFSNAPFEQFLTPLHFPTSFDSFQLDFFASP